ncbi:CU044_2847 family protein [Streptomyces sp. 4N124]|uniref:CU044_2847 family protein n=1 Tax=Streptomyces sp. 4N124 TaxID=3457420 RepID=UPI003FD29054
MDATNVPAQTSTTTPVPVAMPDGSRLYLRAEPIGTAVALPSDDEHEIAGRLPSLDQIAHAVGGFTGQISEALKKTAPTRFTLTFDCEVGFEAGGLVALIGKGSGKSAFSVTMEWDRMAQESPLSVTPSEPPGAATR